LISRIQKDEIPPEMSKFFDGYYNRKTDIGKMFENNMHSN
jgi:hypothetical protein